MAEPPIRAIIQETLRELLKEEQLKSQKVKAKKVSFLDRILGFLIDKAIDSYFHGIWLKKVKGKSELKVVYY